MILLGNKTCIFEPKIQDWKFQHLRHQIQIQIWAFTHLEDVFYFQDVSKVNENQVAFTIGIQTLM
jgi:hypothetical protein